MDSFEGRGRTELQQECSSILGLQRICCLAAALIVQLVSIAKPSSEAAAPAKMCQELQRSPENRKD